MFYGLGYIRRLWNRSGGIIRMGFWPSLAYAVHNII